MENNEFLSRFTMMLTENEQVKLFSARVIVFGVGGVGGAVAHMLARSGIQHLDIVDFDSVDVTNINRQFVAYQNNVGKLKVDELEKQLKQINPGIEIKKYPFKLDEKTINNDNKIQDEYLQRACHAKKLCSSNTDPSTPAHPALLYSPPRTLISGEFTKWIKY